VLSQTIVVVAGAQRTRLFISADLRHFSLNARHEAENACIRRIRLVGAEGVGKVRYPSESRSWLDLDQVENREHRRLSSDDGFAMEASALKILERLRLRVELHTLRSLHLASEATAPPTFHHHRHVVRSELGTSRNEFFAKICRQV
jgi:hypothetical protein